MPQSVLKHHAEFAALLKNYQVSQTGRAILAETPVALLCSVTSAGRNTIIHELLKTGGYYYLVSDTTRPMRVNNGVPEQDGVEYWFRSEEAVLSDLEHGLFLEAAIIHEQQVSGISIREITAARDSGKIATTDIEVVGVETIMQAKPDAKAIFVLPPNFDEWMRRLKHRGELSSEEIERRLRSAEDELKRALSDGYFYFVVNDDLQQAVTDVRAIAEEQRVNEEHQAAGQQKVQELLEQLRAR